MALVSIGNDVVDCAVGGPALHARYLGRIFSERERQAIGTEERKLWLYWTAKEAAYKALKRLDPTIIFSPIRFEYDANSQSITFKEHIVHCRHTVAGDFIYTVCVTSPSIFSSGRFHSWLIDLSSLKRQSDTHLAAYAREAVRSLAVSKISTLLNIPVSALSVSGLEHRNEQDADLVPRLSIDDCKTTHLVSFTHDGRFASCALLLDE